MRTVSPTWVFAVGAGWLGSGSVSAPIRMCLGCRLRAPKAELVRLAWSGGAVVVDPAQTLPGRGGYVHPACGAVAAKRRALGHALRRAVDAQQAEAVLTRLAD